MRYEIRSMSFGEILDAGFRLVRDQFVLLVGLSALVYVPLALVTDYFTRVAATMRHVGLGFGYAFVVFILVLIAAPIINAAITLAIGETYLGRPVSFGGCLRAGLSLIIPLTGTSLLWALGIFIGFMLLVIPGIYLVFAWMLTWQVAVLERRFGFGALQRSRELMRGNFLRGFGIIFVGMLIVSVLGGALQLALRYIPLVGPIGSGLAQAAGAAYTTAVMVLLYFDIRCRKEALDVELLAQLVRAAEGGAPAQIL
jgi:hypothetical protein